MSLTEKISFSLLIIFLKCNIIMLIVLMLFNIFFCQGSPNMRRSAASQIRAGKFNVVLTTYEYVMRDKSVLSKVGAYVSSVIKNTSHEHVVM